MSTTTHGPMNEHDPNGIPQHEPGAKLDGGKPRAGLVLKSFSRALAAVSEVGTYGAQKYTPNGWKWVADGVPRYTDAMVRHFLEEAITDLDDESGLPHSFHVAWNALARLELMLRHREANGARRGDADQEDQP
jgi:hypothetical protein